MSIPTSLTDAEQLDQACAAHDALSEAVAAMRSHAGPRIGPQWARKVQAYREAWDQFDAVFKAIKGESE